MRLFAALRPRSEVTLAERVLSALVLGAAALLPASCASSIASQHLVTSEGRMAYARVDGAGGEQDLVLIHGTPATSASYSDLLERADELTVDSIIVVDRIGFGASEPTEVLTLEGHAKSIIELIDALELDDPIVVGHSYGGPVALKVGALADDRVGGLVILAGACDPEMDDSKWFRSFVDHLAFMLPRTWIVGNRELYHLNDENATMREQLDGITGVVSIVHGTHDLVCPHDDTIAYLEEQLVNAREVRVVSREWWGHNVHLTSLDEVVGEINHIAAGEETRAP